MENKSYTYCTIDLAATGNRIKNLLSQCGLTVKDLCEVVGVSNQTVYRWINGKALPSIENMVQLSEIFKVGLDDILVRGGSVSYQVPAIYVRENMEYDEDDSEK